MIVIVTMTTMRTQHSTGYDMMMILTSIIRAMRTPLAVMSPTNKVAMDTLSRFIDGLGPSFALVFDFLK